MRSTSGIRRIAGTIGRTVAGDRVSRGYLAVFAALLVWVAVDSTLVAHADASFAGVWLVFAALPGSLLVLLPGVGTALTFPLLVAAALLNSTVISLLVRHLTPGGGTGTDTGRPATR